jgi:hypothetical protein
MTTLALAQAQRILRIEESAPAQNGDGLLISRQVGDA